MDLLYFYCCTQMLSLFRLQRFFASIKYSKTHQWIEFDATKKTAKIGITDYAQSQLGQIIHVQFPAVGKKLAYQQCALVIESVKIAADVNTLADGKVTSINAEAQKNPTLINEKAQKTWLFQIQYTKEPEGLLSEQQYKKFIAH